MAVWRFVAAACVGAAIAVTGTVSVLSVRLNALQARELESAREAQIAREAHSKVLAEAEALRVALSAAAAARDELARKREMHRQATKRFGQRLVARTGVRIAREAGAVAPRSIPGAGALVNVSMLALTAAEVCLTLKELTELYTALEEPGEQTPRFCGVASPSH